MNTRSSEEEKVNTAVKEGRMHLDTMNDDESAVVRGRYEIAERVWRCLSPADITHHEDLLRLRLFHRQIRSDQIGLSLHVWYGCCANASGAAQEVGYWLRRTRVERIE